MCSCECEEEDDSVSLLEAIESALVREFKKNLPPNPWEAVYRRIYTPERIVKMLYQSPLGMKIPAGIEKATSVQGAA